LWEPCSQPAFADKETEVVNCKLITARRSVNLTLVQCDWHTSK